jgi:hypothetical protein
MTEEQAKKYTEQLERELALMERIAEHFRGLAISDQDIID